MPSAPRSAMATAMWPLNCPHSPHMASTGRTLALAARLLLQAGAASVDVAVTHALFAGDALQVLHEAGVGEVWSTDCIPHPSNAVAMAGPLATALQSALRT